MKKDRTKKRLQVLVLLSPKNLEIWNKQNFEFKRYFKMDEIFDKPQNITNYLNKTIDVLIMDDSSYFKNNYYGSFQKVNQSFSYILLSSKPDPEKDIQWSKELVDRIIYTDISDKYFAWMIISELRRHWNSYSKPSTIIYKDIIADFVEGKYLVNKKDISLTPKEAALLRLFLINKHRFIPKNTIFVKVWGHEEDNTRTVDQTLFKLKKKIGVSYFTSSRNKGVKFE